MMSFAVYGIVAVLVCPLLSSAFLVEDGYRLVQTKQGAIIGHVEIFNFEGRNIPVSRFLGIPYAEPPVGKLRFQKPVPVTRMTSSTSGYEAHSFKSSCLQGNFGLSHGTMSEDCLFLNIFAPANSGKPGVSPKPVMVWIHGGGFLFGESNTYEGDVISVFSDVIIVTFNYRLGPIGFFSTNDDFAPGNYGLWDQHAAIKWVNENIGSFGGSNSGVTIFGESAGGASVFFQMMYPGNKGLFRHAIVESGSLAPWMLAPAGHNYNNSLAFARILGCNTTTRTDIFRCINSKSSIELEQAVNAANYMSLDFLHPTWVPVFDGDFVMSDPASMLVEATNPATASRYPAFKDTHLLVGANSADGAVLMPSWFGPSSLQTVSENEFRNKNVPILLEAITKRTADSTTRDVVVHEYVNSTGAVSNVVDALLRAVTDAMYVVPAVRTARSHTVANTSSTYLYEFSVAPPNRFYPVPLYLQNDTRAASHADELLYIYGFTSPIAKGLFNISGPISAQDLQMSKFMMTAWTNFAKSGDPNRPTDLSHVFNVTWPAFDLTSQPYLEITKGMSQQSVKHKFAERAVEFWSQPSFL